MYRARSPLWMLLALSGPVGLSACGSTVQVAPAASSPGQLGPGGGTQPGTSSSVGGPSGGPVASPGSAPGQAPGGAGGPAAAAVVAPGGSHGRAPGPVVPGGRSGAAAGVTPTTISIGVPYLENGAAGNQAIGAAGVSFGNGKADAQIVIDDINRHGGVLGRRLVPVFHAFDAQSAQTDDQQLAAACADFTQDHHVFAVIGFPGYDSFNTCLQKAGVVQVAEDVTISNGQTFQRFPYYVEVGTLNLDRSAAQQVQALVAQHYFSPWNTSAGSPGTGAVKVGVLTYDHPDFTHPVNSVLLPALARAGYPAAAVARIAYPQRFADLSSETAQVQDAMLSFRTAGVTHVVIFDGSGTLSLFFLNDAESQHYRPRYGVNSQSAFGVLASTGDDPKPQFTGALGIGWYPIIDVPDQGESDNGPYANAARKHCAALMRAGGQSFSDPNAERDALLTCNEMYFFRQALLRSGSTVSRAGFLAGVNGVGAAFQSATTPATYFGPAQHDGVAAVYYWRYDNGCGCMRYDGGPHRIG